MNLLKKLRSKLVSRIKQHPLIFETIHVFYGFRSYKKIVKAVGKNTKIILLRGATGDRYLQLLLLNEYLRQHEINQYTIVASPGTTEHLKKIFYISNILYINSRESDFIQRAALFFNKKNFNICMPFYWDYYFGFTYNRCRVRMLDSFNFMDTYVFFSYNINYPINFRQPVFEEKNIANKFIWQSQGIVPSKTVFISPEANSVTQLPIWFWNGIISELQNNGYHCVVNCNHPNFFRCSSYFPTYETIVPIFELGGFFLGIRSGLCDIISTAKCKKIIIYPEKQKRINFSEHRSEIEFSGLKEMGLLSHDDNSCIELSTPLIRNITDEESLLEGTEDFFSAIKLLREQIILQF